MYSNLNEYYSASRDGSLILDNYLNEMCEVPIKVEYNSPGIITLENISVIYDDEFESRNFANIINKHSNILLT